MTANSGLDLFEVCQPTLHLTLDICEDHHWKQSQTDCLRVFSVGAEAVYAQPIARRFELKEVSRADVRRSRAKD